MFTEDHPWISRFLGLEAVLILTTVSLVFLTPSTPTTNPLGWNPLKIVGLLVGAFTVIVTVFALVVAVVYIFNRVAS